MGKYFWPQVRDLTLASMKARYRKTWAGFLWVIMSPILLFGVQSLVFRKFLKINIFHYDLFLLTGLLPWIFIASTLQMGTPIFVTQSQLLRAFKINPLVVIAAQILDNFINFLLSFFLILVPFYFYAERTPELLFVSPLFFLPLVIGTGALTIILSTLNVFYRDINFVMGFILSLMFFLTPIFYPRSYIPEEWQWAITWNPFYGFIEPLRLLLYQNDLIASLILWGKGLALATLFCILAIWTWKRNVNDFYRKL